jgi:hypothetical protein
MSIIVSAGEYDTVEVMRGVDEFFLFEGTLQSFLFLRLVLDR